MTDMTRRLRKDSVKTLRIRTWFRYILHTFYDMNAGLSPKDPSQIFLAIPLTPIEPEGSILTRTAGLPDDDEIINLIIGALQKWLDKYAELPDYVEALTKIGARDYWLGTKPPRTNTLDAFEIIFPGSKSVYETGPGHEPVWDILSGDLKRSRSYLNEVVGCRKGEVWSYQQYFAALLQGLVAPVFLKELNFSDFSSKRAVGFHPVLLTWINEQLRLVEDDPENLLPTPYVADQILAVFALWNLCLAERGPIFLELEWLLVGLCRGMVYSAFDDQIEQTILELVKADAEQLDSVFSQANPSWTSFTERWNGVPLQDLKFE